MQQDRPLSLLSGIGCSRGLVVVLTAIFGLCPSTLTLGSDPIDVSRTRIGKMSASDKDVLRQKRNRFNNLTPRKKQELRNLHRELSHQPELRRTMDAYFEWLKTLSPNQIAELKQLSLEDRIRRIKKLRQDQEMSHIGRLASKKLSRNDLWAVQDWLADFAKNHEEEILVRLGPKFRANYERMENGRKKRTMLSLNAHRRKAAPSPTAVEIEQLVDRLSPEAVGELQSIPDVEQRNRVLGQWLDTVLAIQRPRVRGNHAFPSPTPRTLERFWREELSDRERRELDQTDAREMRYRLRQRFLEHHRRRQTNADSFSQE